MTMRTVDEARLELVASARCLIATCRSDDAFTVAAMLWGAGQLAGLTPADRRLTRRHRRLLDELNDAGYGADVAAELEGLSSAYGLDDGVLHRHAL